MSPDTYSKIDPDDTSWLYFSVIFSAHWEVDKSEDIKLYQYRETQENDIEGEHIDAQFPVKFPFI